MTTKHEVSTDPQRRYGYLAARVMLAAIFLLTGWDKLADRQDAAADIAEVGLPAPVPLAVLAGVVEVMCGALLVLGWRTAWAAGGLLLFLLPVTVLLENPLAASADFGTLIDFLKNLAIMGGLLIGCAVGAPARRRLKLHRSLAPDGLFCSGTANPLRRTAGPGSRPSSDSKTLLVTDPNVRLESRPRTSNYSTPTGASGRGGRAQNAATLPWSSFARPPGGAEQHTVRVLEVAAEDHRLLDADGFRAAVRGTDRRPETGGKPGKRNRFAGTRLLPHFLQRPLFERTALV